MKKVYLVLLSLLMIGISFAQEAPIKAYYGLYMKNLVLENQGKDKSNQFAADFYWWIRAAVPEDSALVEELENFEFVNAQNASMSIDERYEYVDKETGRKHVYMSGHLKGVFIYEPNFKFYPFDKQVLPITLESLNLESDIFQFIADTLEEPYGRFIGIPEELKLMTFNITDTRYKSENKIYHTTFGDPRIDGASSYSSLSYEIVVERKHTVFLMKILIPLFLITMMAYLVLYFPPGNVQAAAALTATSLLSAIALQMTMSNNVPATGYIITTDKLFYASYALITTCMILSLITFYKFEEKQMESIQKIRGWARWLYPFIFIVFTLLNMFMALNIRP